MKFPIFNMDIKVIASGSSGNATIINDGKTALLLDAGISIKDLERGSGFMLSRVSACLVTHEHQDHSKACKDLAKRGTDIYASAGTLRAINADGHRYKAVSPLTSFSVGTFDIMAFDVKHDAAEPFGYLIYSSHTHEKLLYFVDTAYVRYSFSNVDYFVVECNHGERELRESVSRGVISPELAARIAKNHLSLERLLNFLKANDISRAKEIHLVHLSDNNSNEQRFKQEVQRATGVQVYIH